MLESLQPSVALVKRVNLLGTTENIALWQVLCIVFLLLWLQLTSFRKNTVRYITLVISVSISIISGAAIVMLPRQDRLSHELEMFAWNFCMVTMGSLIAVDNLVLLPREILKKTRTYRREQRGEPPRPEDVDEMDVGDEFGAIHLCGLVIPYYNFEVYYHHCMGLVALINQQYRLWVLERSQNVDLSYDFAQMARGNPAQYEEYLSLIFDGHFSNTYIFIAEFSSIFLSLRGLYEHNPKVSSLTKIVTNICFVVSFVAARIVPIPYALPHVLVAETSWWMSFTWWGFVALNFFWLRRISYHVLDFLGFFPSKPKVA